MTCPSLIWLDTETNCLDPRETGAALLELALVVTDAHGEREQFFSAPIQFTGTIKDDYVRNMHTVNGLLAECRAPSAMSLAAVEDAAIRFLTRARAHPFPFSERSPMCGSSVQFDREWIRVHMPRLMQCFHYRNIDASSLWQWAIRQGIDVPDRKTPSRHRALDDCRDSVQLARTVWALARKPDRGELIQRLDAAGFDLDEELLEALTR